jgi:hypothetical protein
MKRLKPNFRPNLVGLQAALSEAKKTVDSAVNVSLEHGPQVDVVVAALLTRAFRDITCYKSKDFFEEES